MSGCQEIYLNILVAKLIERLNGHKMSLRKK